MKQELRESREQLSKMKSDGSEQNLRHFRQTQGFDNFEARRSLEVSEEAFEKEKVKVSELSKVSSRRSSKSVDSERKKGGAAKALLRSKREREAIPQVEAGAIIEMLEDHEEDRKN